MKIVSRSELLQLPAGTVFMLNDGSDNLSTFDGPGSGPDSFIATAFVRLSGEDDIALEHEGREVELSPGSMHFLGFDYPESRFIILDAHDLLQLRSLIDRALDVAGGSTP